MRSRLTGARWLAPRRPRRARRDSPPAWLSSMRPAARSWRPIRVSPGRSSVSRATARSSSSRPAPRCRPSTPQTCIPSVNSPCPRASPSWASRRRTSWSVRCRGRPPGGTRPPARSSRPRAIRSPPRPGRRWSLRCRHRRSGRAVSLLARVRRRAAVRAAGRPHHRAGAGDAGDAGTGRRESERDVERRLVDGHVGVRHPHPRRQLRCARRHRQRAPARCCASSGPRSGRSRARSRTPRAIACSPPGRRRRGLVPLEQRIEYSRAPWTRRGSGPSSGSRGARR